MKKVSLVKIVIGALTLLVVTAATMTALKSFGLLDFKFKAPSATLAPAPATAEVGNSAPAAAAAENQIIELRPLDNCPYRAQYEDAGNSQSLDYDVTAQIDYTAKTLAIDLSQSIYVSEVGHYKFEILYITKPYQSLTLGEIIHPSTSDAKYFPMYSFDMTLQPGIIRNYSADLRDMVIPYSFLTDPSGSVVLVIQGGIPDGELVEGHQRYKYHNYLREVMIKDAILADVNTDGSFEDGYAAGKTDGQAEGYDKGRNDGINAGKDDAAKAAEKAASDAVTKTESEMTLARYLALPAAQDTKIMLIAAAAALGALSLLCVWALAAKG